MHFPPIEKRPGEEEGDELGFGDANAAASPMRHKLGRVWLEGVAQGCLRVPTVSVPTTHPPHTLHTHALRSGVSERETGGLPRRPHPRHAHQAVSRGRGHQGPCFASLRPPLAHNPLPCSPLAHNPLFLPCITSLSSYSYRLARPRSASSSLTLTPLPLPPSLFPPSLLSLAHPHSSLPHSSHPPHSSRSSHALTSLLPHFSHPLTPPAPSPLSLSLSRPHSSPSLTPLTPLSSPSLTSLIPSLTHPSHPSTHLCPPLPPPPHPTLQLRLPPRRLHHQRAPQTEHLPDHAPPRPPQA